MILKSVVGMEQMKATFVTLEAVEFTDNIKAGTSLDFFPIFKIFNQKTFKIHRISYDIIFTA